MATYEIIDIGKWERKDIYNHFSSQRLPFYSVSANIDVTKLIDYKNRHGLSFYLSLVYLATKALNSIEEFRMRIVDGQPVRFPIIPPNLTHKRKEDRTFKYYTGRMEGTMEQFERQMTAGMEAQETLFGGYGASQDLYYFSCFPWTETTAITNPGMENADDAIPRVNWGKYGLHEGRQLINVNVTANHRFIDGYHIGQFLLKLQQLIDTLDDATAG